MPRIEREGEGEGAAAISHPTGEGGGNSGADLEGLGQVPVRVVGRTAYPIPGAVHFTAAAGSR